MMFLNTMHSKNHTLSPTLSRALSLFLALGFGGGQVPQVGQEVSAAHVLLQHFGDPEALGCLVVFDDGAHGALRGAERAVEHVHVALDSVALLLDAAAHLKGAGFYTT